jgi:hypothetical protein
MTSTGKVRPGTQVTGKANRELANRLCRPLRGLTIWKSWPFLVHNLFERVSLIDIARGHGFQFQGY